MKLHVLLVAAARRAVLLASALPWLLGGCAGSSSGSGNTQPVPTPSAGAFTETKLVANTPGVAKFTDPNLVNAWGMSYSPGGPFWISDNGTGLSTLYGGDGSLIPLVVKIPAAPGSTAGPVSGQVFNGSAGFGGAPFIFDSEDGLITSWSGGSAAVTSVDRSATGAVYKGLAIGTLAGSPALFATNFNSGFVDVFDANFKLVNSFTDPAVPTGFAPFGIALFNTHLYVTFAKQNSKKHDDVAGLGNGFIDVFNTDGTLVQRLASGGVLNSPWGLAVAPSGFGKLSGDLLVGNFGDGLIHAYNPSSGKLVGQFQTSSGAVLAIDGLWGIMFGNGGGAGPKTTLYFTAGPNKESAGLLGSIVPTP